MKLAEYISKISVKDLIRFTANDLTGYYTRKIQKQAEFDNAIYRLIKITNYGGYMNTCVLVDELKNRFNEDKLEIIGILNDYALKGGSLKDLLDYIFSKPQTYFKERDINLSYFIIML